MSIRYICENCGQKYTSDDKYAERKVKCTQCGTLLAIPKPESPPVDPLDVHDSPPMTPPLVTEAQVILNSETVEQIPVSETPPEPILTFESPKMSGANILKRTHPEMNTSGTSVTSKEANDLYKVNERIKFVCPECRATFEVDDSMAGQKAKCFNCKTRFIVPALGENWARKLESAAGVPSLEKTATITPSDSTIVEKIPVEFNFNNNKTPPPPETENIFKKYFPGRRLEYIICLVLILFAAGVVSAMFNLNPFKSRFGDESPEPQDAYALMNPARQGDAQAQHDLGWCYENGVGVGRDATEALKLYHKAGGQGNAKGQYALGRCYMNAVGTAKDEAEAVKWYRQAAELGLTKAQYELGICYSDGCGVKKDLSEGAKWYRLASDQGNSDAQYRLAVYLENADDAARDSAEAEKWYRKAAKQDHAQAMDAVKKFDP